MDDDDVLTNVELEFYASASDKQETHGTPQRVVPCQQRGISRHIY